MRIIVRVLLIVLALSCALVAPAQAAPQVHLDDTTARKLDELLAVRASAGADKGALIEVLSRQFLGTPYGANMLIGSDTTPEQLVVDLRRVDCFTYLDYVEALTSATDRDSFLDNLVRTRYRDARVDYAHRKHFFTDWAHTGAATNVTAAVSPAATTVTKHLNAKADGGHYLPGLPVTDRQVTYIPSTAVTPEVIANLRTGDYLGAYTDQAGLDVTHVGIFVAGPSGPIFRNASSLSATYEVVDTPLTDYLRTVPGLLVLRTH